MNEVVSEEGKPSQILTILSWKYVAKRAARDLSDLCSGRVVTVEVLIVLCRTCHNFMYFLFLQ